MSPKDGIFTKVCAITALNNKAKMWLFWKARSGEAGSRKNTGIKVNIDIDYLIDLFKLNAGRCSLTGIELKTFKTPNLIKDGCFKPANYTNLSIDRIDSTKGYVPGNIQLVCSVINRMKGEMSQEMFIDFCNAVID